jgi:hypothetical protein
MSLPPLKIVLKTKDEDFLIESWLEYYKNLVGEENIIIYDDHSTSTHVLDTYSKYKKVDIRKMPKEFAHFHGLHTYLELREEMKQACMYYTIIDTDEFLCFFDHDKKTIDNSKVLDFISANNHRDVFPTTWIFNMYHGSCFKKLTDVRDFNFELSTVNVDLGKAIASSSGRAGENIGHNISTATNTSNKVKMQSCPELLLLHTNHVNWESRIKTRINFARQAGVKFNSLEELLEQIKNKSKKTYHEIDIFEYYTDREKFFNNKAVKMQHNHMVMTTDVLSSWSNNQAISKTSLTDVNFDLREKINNLFERQFNKPDKFDFVKA